MTAVFILLHSSLRASCYSAGTLSTNKSAESPKALASQCVMQKSWFIYLKIGVSKKQKTEKVLIFAKK
ncbi:hypothetical protein [Nostoc sp. FACHB-110]|uniref:hypothetical protein n=1 Tax=Nostoc sp. FACHB-110 TaxID=2692834 RepID=UPI00168879BC|nr:hypothetical protein [Nostoc sp. FACHB-110]MBD2438406.1 hypothetical protein [Nostoc sp. FACHB-110]